MPTGRPGRYCKACNQLETADNPLSRRRLHQACAEDRYVTTMRQIAEGKGPAYEKWLAGQLAFAAKASGATVVYAGKPSRKRKRAA